MTIKRSADDFMVTEQLDEAVAVSGRPRTYVLYRLIKQQIDTPTAARELARMLNVAYPTVSYAGLKDKYARTTQHLTVRLGKGASSAPRKLEARLWRAERLGWVQYPLRADAIAANQFDIVVRGMSQAAADRMAEQAAAMRVNDGVLRVVNYFGDQRFGSARHGRGFAARHLIRGEFEAALRLLIATPSEYDTAALLTFKNLIVDHWGAWRAILPALPKLPETAAIAHLAKQPDDFRGAFTALPYLIQQLTLEAYQSLLWNRIAVRIIERHCESKLCSTAKDPFGDLLFPSAAAVPASLANLALPLLGRNSPLEEPWRAAAEDVLAEGGITTADLHVPGLRRPWFGKKLRPLFAEVRQFELGSIQPDGQRFARTIQFTLPRGSYATVVLRALGQ